MLGEADNEQELADGCNDGRHSDDVGTTHATIEHLSLPRGGPNTHDPP